MPGRLLAADGLRPARASAPVNVLRSGARSRDSLKGGTAKRSRWRIHAGTNLIQGPGEVVVYHEADVVDVQAPGGDVRREHYRSFAWRYYRQRRSAAVVGDRARARRVRKSISRATKEDAIASWSHLP